MIHRRLLPVLVAAGDAPAGAAAIVSLALLALLLAGGRGRVGDRADRGGRRARPL